jgi:quercetin dioxygenase-like cupin family protein
MLKAVKTFNVLGEKVEILVTSASTNGSFNMLVHNAPPGGGPPPHVHQFEDEIFTVLEGDFELFDGERYIPLEPGVPAYTLRNHPHTFRNSGTTDGKILVVVVDGKLDEYLESISPLELPRDMERLIQISAEYGITFLPPS